MSKKEEKPVIIRADFINSDTPNYVNDISFVKFESNPEYSRRIIDLKDKTEKEKLLLIFDLIDNFSEIVIFEKREI
jgi:hypothetical protein